MSNKIVNVKINGELVLDAKKIKGVHLCGDHCPIEVSMRCPKVATCGNLNIMKYPFIIDGMQVVEEKERVINKTTGETRKVMEVTQLIVTKCKRYSELKDSARKVKK